MNLLFDRSIYWPMCTHMGNWSWSEGLIPKFILSLFNSLHHTVFPFPQIVQQIGVLLWLHAIYLIKYRIKIWITPLVQYVVSLACHNSHDSPRLRIAFLNYILSILIGVLELSAAGTLNFTTNILIFSIPANFQLPITRNKYFAVVKDHTRLIFHTTGHA